MTGSRAKAYAISAVALLVLGLLIGAQVWTKSRLVDSNYCLPSGPVGIVAIAIDATDRLSEVQRLDLRNKILAAVERVPDNWRVEIWAVAPSSGVPNSVGPSRCKPPVETSYLVSNPARAKQRLSTFRADLGAQIDSVMNSGSSPRSPIMETLQAIALRSFGVPEAKDLKERKIVLASDLIQNTATLSLVAGLPPVGDFLRSQGFSTLRAPLEGAAIELLLVDRPGEPESPGNLVAWWQEFLARCGARVTLVERIAG